MPFQFPSQLAFETLAHGPASRAARLADAFDAARRERAVAGDRWMQRLIFAGTAAAVGLAVYRQTFVPAVWVLIALGHLVGSGAWFRFRGSRYRAVVLGFATHLVGWGLSVQLGARIEWGAIFFVATTAQLRYEDARVILPCIAFYILQHLLQWTLLTSGVSLDFLWSGAYDPTSTLLAILLAVAQGYVIIEIARALSHRNETSIRANHELVEQVAQSQAQAAALQRTEATLSGVVGGSEDAMAVFDADTRVLIWNPRMEQVTGVRAEDALGRLRAEVYGTTRARSEAMQSALNGTAAHVNNVVYVNQTTQQTGVLDMSYLPLRDAAGTVIGAFTVAHDVSERIEAAGAISTMRQQLLEAIEAIDAGFALFDADDRVIQANSAYREYYKEIEDQFEPGTPYINIATAYLTVFPEYAAGQPIEEAVQSWVAARSERTNTKEYQQGDRWLLLQDRPTASGGRVSLRTDISNQKRIQRELEEARSRAEAANRAKSEFLARMSHELRTPLNSIIGFSRLVKANKLGALSPKDVNFLDRVSANGEHLLTLINDILDLSRIEAGRMPVLVEEIDCNAMVLDTIRMLEGQAQSETRTLIAHISQTQLNLSTDAAKLRQVLINLVGNALKFTTDGTITVRVEEAQAPKGAVVFSVIDTGIGIPSERLLAIFEAFEQADGTTSRQYGGTGLGLTISRSLCLLIDATLSVESEVGVGSTFRVTCQPLLRRSTPAAPVTLTAPKLMATVPAH